MTGAKLDLSDELIFKTARSGGKGGQNVNKVETMVEASWDPAASHLVTADQKEKIFRLIANRISTDGVLSVRSREARTQLENKRIAIHKLHVLVQQALKPRKRRIATQPSKASKEKRLDEKKLNSMRKANRKNKGNWKNFLLLLLSFSALFGCQEEIENDFTEAVPNSSLVVKILPKVGNENLSLNAATYTNVWGEEFTVKTFNFYLSNIKINQKSTGKSFALNNQYFLFQSSRADLDSLLLQIPAGTYDQIEFLLGVDSTRNVSGAQTGALDPANGMFWTWNSGYVMAKLEGFSDSAKTPNKEFSYHVGGFRVGQNALQTIKLDVSPFVLSENEKVVLQLEADVLEWFSGPNALKIAQKSFVHSPGDDAVNISNNYKSMFTLKRLD